MTSHPGDLGAVVPEVAEEEGAGPLPEPEPWWCAAVLRWWRGWSRDYLNLLTLSEKLTFTRLLPGGTLRF